MSHSLSKIWIHTVFGTKNRESTILKSFEQILHDHLKKHLEDDFNCKTQAINGISNHIHILFLLNPNFSIKDILKNIKGESSHWVNQQSLTGIKFAWQIGYGAFSVSESNIESIIQYIRNQKEHHRHKTYLEEYIELMERHGLECQPETVETVSTDE